MVREIRKKFVCERITLEKNVKTFTARFAIIFSSGASDYRAGIFGNVIFATTCFAAKLSRIGRQKW